MAWRLELKRRDHVRFCNNIEYGNLAQTSRQYEAKLPGLRFFVAAHDGDQFRGRPWFRRDRQSEFRQEIDLPLQDIRRD